MKTFIFNLQSLLDLRSHFTEQAGQFWALAANDLRDATLKARRGHADLKSWQQERREQQSAPAFAGDLTRSFWVSHEFYRQWIALEHFRRNMEGRVRQAQEKWNEAHMKQEILERLKHRHHLVWIKEHEKQEQKLIDERASIQRFRNRVPVFGTDFLEKDKSTRNPN